LRLPASRFRAACLDFVSILDRAAKTADSTASRKLIYLVMSFCVIGIVGLFWLQSHGLRLDELVHNVYSKKE